MDDRRHEFTRGNAGDEERGTPVPGPSDAQRAREVARCAIRMESLAQLARGLGADDVLKMACEILADAMPIVRATLTLDTPRGPQVLMWRRRNGGPEIAHLMVPIDERRGVTAGLAFELDAHPSADARILAESFMIQLCHALSRVPPPVEDEDEGEVMRSGTHATAACVLLVDDDDRVARAVSDLLALEGHRVRRACNGAEALDIMRSERPRVVLLDVNMPVMDGREFRRHQLADDSLRDVPVIVISAHDDGSFDDGVIVLGKPFALRELNDAMAEAEVRKIA